MEKQEIENGKEKPSLAATVAAIGATVLGFLRFGERRGQQPAEFDYIAAAALVTSQRVGLEQPTDALARYGLGIALAAQGKLEPSVTQFRSAIRIKPDFPDAHNDLGEALRKQGKLEEAIVEFRTAIRLKLDIADAHNNLGVALDDQGKQEETVAEFR
ncbi:MAG: tetratricopeptide repeat protein [Isosphaeraceae bacterium]